MKAARPVQPVRAGRGAMLTLEDGRPILDCISSWWVTLHGHGQPEIAAAVAAQAQELEQVIAAGFTHRPAEELARRLAEALPAPLEWVFYSDDGSTAVEVALKLAYQFWHNQGEHTRTRFLRLEGAYHGDTLGAMSVGERSLFTRPFADLLFPADAVPFPATWAGDEEVEAKEARALARLEELETRSDARVASEGPRATMKKTPPLTVGRGPVPRQATIAGDRPPRYGKTAVFIRSSEISFEKTALQVRRTCMSIDKRAFHRFHGSPTGN